MILLTISKSVRNLFPLCFYYIMFAASLHELRQSAPAQAHKKQHLSRVAACVAQAVLCSVRLIRERKLSRAHWVKYVSWLEKKCSPSPGPSSSNAILLARSCTSRVRVHVAQAVLRSSLIILFAGTALIIECLQISPGEGERLFLFGLPIRG